MSRRDARLPPSRRRPRPISSRAQSSRRRLAVPSSSRRSSASRPTSPGSRPRRWAHASRSRSARSSPASRSKRIRRTSTRPRTPSRSRPARPRCPPCCSSHTRPTSAHGALRSAPGSAAPSRSCSRARCRAWSPKRPACGSRPMRSWTSATDSGPAPRCSSCAISRLALDEAAASGQLGGLGASIGFAIPL